MIQIETPDWSKWLPKRKVLAGGIAYLVIEVLGPILGIEGSVFTLPLLGEVDVNELAILIAAYLVPEKE